MKKANRTAICETITQDACILHVRFNVISWLDYHKAFSQFFDCIKKRRDCRGRDADWSWFAMQSAELVCGTAFIFCRQLVGVVTVHLLQSEHN